MAGAGSWQRDVDSALHFFYGLEAFMLTRCRWLTYDIHDSQKREVFGMKWAFCVVSFGLFFWFIPLGHGKQYTIWGIVPGGTKCVA